MFNKVVGVGCIIVGVCHFISVIIDKGNGVSMVGIACCVIGVACFRIGDNQKDKTENKG